MHARTDGLTSLAEADLDVDPELTLTQAHDLAHRAEAHLMADARKITSATIHTTHRGPSIDVKNERRAAAMHIHGPGKQSNQHPDDGGGVIHRATVNAISGRDGPTPTVPDQSMIGVVISLALHHLPAAERPRALAEILRVLKPGGHLVIAEFRAPKGRLGKPVARHTFGHAMAENALAPITDLTVAAGSTNIQLLNTAIPWVGLVTAQRPVRPWIKPAAPR